MHHLRGNFTTIRLPIKLLVGLLQALCIERENAEEVACLQMGHMLATFRPLYRLGYLDTNHETEGESNRGKMHLPAHFSLAARSRCCFTWIEWGAFNRHFYVSDTLI